MYSYTWDEKTHGYILTTQTGKFVANEIRPVFAEELDLLQFDQRFAYDKIEIAPLMWAQKNVFWADGEKVAQLNKIEHEKPITAEYFFDKKKKLHPVDIPKMINANTEIMDALVFDTLKRIKEMFDQYANNIPYIAFSGGKDSVVLLDLCHRVLPLNVPVVFSDTDMELPDTYKVWDEIQKRYPERKFIKAQADKSAIENWRLFGPPSRVLRWCCSVHKISPAILALRNLLMSNLNPASKFLCFVGVRGDESARRSEYEDIGEGKKNNNQVQAMPILEWSAHELWLYIFQKKLIINKAYRKGLQRVGCILCPMSSDRHTIFCQKLYQKSIAKFAEEIINSSNRDFSSQADADNFVYHGGWHARKSGTFLREMIDIPKVKRECDKIKFLLPINKKHVLLTWFKTLGYLCQNEDKYNLFLRNGTITIQIEKKSNELEFELTLNNVTIKNVETVISRLVNKSMMCVGCTVCESECSFGAIRFTPKFQINEEKCIGCQKCLLLHEEGCLRFFSKRYAGGTTMNISGINKYMTFGLNPNWISILITENEHFRSTISLGNRKIPAAVTWFREAGLIGKDTSIKVTRLLDIAKKQGSSDLLLWHCIWLGIVNRSPLVKWYVCNAPLGKTIEREELDKILAKSVVSESVRKGAMQSLMVLLRGELYSLSPLGAGDLPLVHVEMKGKTVKSLMRLPIVPDNLVVLYGLYLMGQLTKRNSFTVREMMNAEFETPCVSPLYAFGIEPPEFQRICNGLSSKYPDFLSVSFTLGLDEIRLNDSKTIDDVLDLILNC
ncbi:MAG: phosphoadenosine phosphosulfate reductase family protein [Planctomycetaceae bacterium]|jgi:3'-phosphoadenosine 5'-phosphosulfate sulfotransferase (PAPS reductase)/FAD synthetase/ferredoxin|nr:phosphoadenosine phosphosulfate reductase family protein [Planctomycetaceae bacterium]